MDYFNVSSKHEKRGILAGMLLGKARKRQNNFFIQHSQQNQAYLWFKKQLLEEITQRPVGLQEWITAQGDRIFRITPKQTPLTRIMLKRLYYPDPVQGEHLKITPTFLEYLTLQGLALWFMDCGSKSFKRKNGKIHALEVFLNTGFSLKDNEVIMTYFVQKWGIDWGLSRGYKRSGHHPYRLRLGTKAGKAWFELLRPYIHPSMSDKINPSYNKTATT